MPDVLLFDKLSKTSLHDEAAKQIKKAILGGTYQPGDSLPAERNLAEALGVGRSTIREALKILRDRGLIDLDWGTRRYVVRNPDLEHCVIPIQDQISWLIQVSENTISEFWAVIPHIIGLAAQAAIDTMTVDSILQLERWLRQMEGSGRDFFACCKASYGFGLELAETTNNRLILLLWKMFDNVIQEDFPPTLSVMEPKGPENLILFHHRILNAIRAKEKEAVYQAVTARVEYLKDQEARTGL